MGADNRAVGEMGVGGYGWGTPPLGEEMLPYMGGDLWQRPLALTNADNDLIFIKGTLFCFEQQMGSINRQPVMCGSDIFEEDWT